MGCSAPLSRNVGQVEALPEAGNCRGFSFEDTQQETPLAQGLLCNNKLPAKSGANPVGPEICDPHSLIFTPAVSLVF